MMFRTHLIFSALMGLILFPFFNVNSFLFFALFLLSSMIPDIDLPQSKIGRRHRIIATILNVLFGHRGFMHTIYPALGFYALFYFLGYPFLGIAIFLGYLSHLFMDMLTPKGIRLFYPFSSFNIKGFIYTASLSEYVLQGVLMLGFLIQLFSYFQ